MVEAAAQAAGVLAAAQLATSHATEDADDTAEATRTAKLLGLMRAPDEPRAHQDSEPTLEELVRRAIHAQARRRIRTDA
jgi:hypothetical protein